MKGQTIAAWSLLAALLGLQGCGSAGSSSPPSSGASVAANGSATAAPPAVISSAAAVLADPAAVAQRWMSAVGAGDVAGALAVMGNNGTLIAGPQCPPTSPCVGHEALMSGVQGLVGDHTKFTGLQSPRVVGSLVRIDGAIQSDDGRAKGADQLKAMWDMQMQGTKIGTLIQLFDLADATAAKYQAAVAVSQSSTDQSDPASVASQWFGVVNAGDMNAAARIFTDKAVFVGGPPCGTLTPCVGPTVIAKRIQTAAASHHIEEAVGKPVVAGDIVQMTWQVREDLDRAAGVDRILWRVQETVEGGKIAAWIGEHDFSDEQTLKFNQYLASRPPVSAKPSGE